VAVAPASSAPDLEFAPGRGALWVTAALAGLLFFALAWLAWAQVDRFVLAEGRIEPAGGARVVNHPMGGRVAAIFVRDGERVRAWQPLLALDGTQLSADLARLRDRREVLWAEIARLEAELEGQLLQVPAELADRRPDLVEAQQRLLQSRRDAREQQRRALVEERESRAAGLARREAEIEGLETEVGLLRRQVEALRELAAAGLYPRVELLTRERELAAGEGRLREARSGLRQLQAALAEAESRLRAFDADVEGRLRSELEARRGELRAIEQELGALESERDGLLVRAPVAGIVRDLRLRAPGQALPPHAPALRIVPEGEELVVRAAVANEDVGRIRPGMEAVLKVRAFDWTRHGTLKGRVRRIDADAETVGPDRPPVFIVVVEIDRQDPAFADWEGRLQPGMVVDVEFRADRRSLLDDLLARLRDSAARAFSEG